MSYRVLVVEDTDLVPDESDKLDEVSVVLRDRNLRFARFSRSDLHRADLTGADLRGAVLREARLEKVRLPKAQLQGADLLLARLGGADLRQARLEGAMLAYARLEGAYLGWVRLQGGALPVRLQGADLGEAQLQGAVLWQASLQGASLAGAQLQGANLAKARLQGADLRQAQLQGANLARAQLQGADLRQAQLQGADLRQAQLQGADLGGAQLQGADFDLAGVWLAHSSGNPDQAPAALGLRQLDKNPPSADVKAELIQELQANIADGKLLESLRKRLHPILRDDPPDWDDTWLSRYSLATDPSVDDYIRFLVKMACEDPGGYVAASMADRAKHYSLTPNRELYGRPLAASLLAESCEGAKAQTDETRVTLKNLAAEPGALPQLGTELSATSVSGFSSGAYMAGQLQLAHSRHIVGAGLVAGGPFACAESDAGRLFPFWPIVVAQNSQRALSSCMQVNGGVPDPSALLSRAKVLADQGEIDPLEGLSGDKVYLFSGDDDRIVVRDVVQSAETFYKKAGLLDANIMFVRQPGGHAFLTEDSVPAYNITIKQVTKKEPRTELEDFLTKLVKKEAALAEQEGRTCDVSAPPFVTDCDYDQTNIALVSEQEGPTCGVSAPPFITDCDYNQAKAILDWIYDSNESPLTRPSTKAQGSFIMFDQRQYGDAGDGFADDGVVYVPSSCQEQIGCRVHVALHGCNQSRETVGDAFINESGFAEMADANRFVILFPQTKATAVNPHGCWDWWGYTGLDYLGNGAPQIAAIWAMVEHLAKSPEVQP